MAFYFTQLYGLYLYYYNQYKGRSYEKKKNLYSKLYYIFISVLIITIIVIAFILYKTREDKQNRSLDYYSNFEELKENTIEGKDWRIKTKIVKIITFLSQQYMAEVLNQVQLNLHVVWPI